ncbi:hypothetical protein EYB26_008026 [Talaromyces marneffei]|uniref:uncharacterized protein n=1 Tax=Talaromyces marneffei TaxID=37727 RepID=UPI0012A9247D|nr:uncharacterized protein EYB26_008026 [Talaromyces marneffei]QGA20324.1 hypothetical protein EYB26_008026 [Talaromyces marneffei]
MLEDLSELYIELFGSYLGVDAQVFAAQIQDGHWGEDEQMGHSPQFLSVNDHEKSFTLRYYETRVLDDPPLDPVPSMVRTAANVSRNVTFQHEVTKGDRNHVWTTEDGTVSDPFNQIWMTRILTHLSAIVLLDPPILDNRLICYYNNDCDKAVQQIGQSRPYQGGYRDFTPWPDKNASHSALIIDGPRRVSLADDIAYYWVNVASSKELILALRNPYESTIFLRRIVISMLNSTLRRYYSDLSQHETKLWVMQRMIDPNLTDSEKNQYLGDFIGVMNEINKIRRRMNWFSHEMTSNLESLNLVTEHPYQIPSHRAEDRDFIIIRDKFLSYRKWSEKLLNITSAHLALMETEKSISDSKALSRLTILGSLFIPVSFVCSFFSMNGDFAVGETKFWVYFAVTLPLVLTILVIVFGRWWYRRLMEVSSVRYRRVQSTLDEERGIKRSIRHSGNNAGA